MKLNLFVIALRNLYKNEFIDFIETSPFPRIFPDNIKNATHN